MVPLAHLSYSSDLESVTQKNFVKRVRPTSLVPRNLEISDSEKLHTGIEPIVDLPGVGCNFQDHYLLFSAYRARPDTETFDEFVRGNTDVQKAAINEYTSKGTGPLSTNGIEAGVKIRPTEQELEEMKNWPTSDFLRGWESYFKNKPDKPVMHYSVIAG